MIKKTTYLFAILMLGMSSTIIAQESDKDPREELSFGIRGGLNRSNVWDEQGQDFRADPKFGFVGGIFVGIPISKNLGFQPELLLSQKGFKGEGTLLGQSYTFSRTTTYLDVPLQLQIKPIEYLTILMGPQYSYLISEKNEYTFGSNSTEQQKEFENDNIRKNILGFTLGADVVISQFVLSGRLGWDFQTNNGDGTSSTPRYKNQWLQMTIGFKI